MAKAFYDGNGNIFCECGQRLGSTQKICPSCKETILVYEKDSSHVVPNNKPGKILSKSIFMLFVILCAIGIFALVDIYKNTKSQTNNKGINNPAKTNITTEFTHSLYKHSEAPIYNDEDDIGGYNFRITQLFFKTEENDTIGNKIETVLINANLEYDGFHYSEEGYYTADIKGLGPYSKKEYESKSDQITEIISEEMKKQELYGIKWTIQSWYETTYR